MKALLVFAGPQDPYAQGLIGEEKTPGTILSTVLSRRFDRVAIFHTDATAENARATAHAIRDRVPTTDAQLVQVLGADTSNYSWLIDNLRAACRPLLTEWAGAEISIVTSPEPAEIHACWVLLVSTGEITARLLHVQSPGYPSDTTATVSEVSVPRLPLRPSSTQPPPPRPAAPHPSFALSEMRRNRPHIMYACADNGPGEPSIHQARVSESAPESPPELAAAMAEVGMVAEAPGMRDVLTQIAALSRHEVPILILGETGTGKELVAKLVHRLSPRAGHPQVVVNCGGLSATLVESTLFGHTRGAFTGAIADQKGKFVEADGGTLFLDEVGNMPMEVQPKLLRVLEDGVVEPLGGRAPVTVRVRVVAATNTDLDEALHRGRFRQDLYYRIAGGVVHLPPLRDRREDIPRIAVRVLQNLNRSASRPRRFTTGALSRLQAHNWPGNIRELQNVISRSMMLCTHELLDADDLLIKPPAHGPDPLSQLPEPNDGFHMEEFLRSVRKQLMLRALEMAAGNQSGAARLLGITPQAVHKFLRGENAPMT